MNREERRREEKLQGKSAGGAAAAAAGLREAQMHHQAGRLDDAERGYQQLLARIPAQPDALHGLGLLLYRRGNFRAVSFY
jgi:Flp pilus assembly protein TadD